MQSRAAVINAGFEFWNNELIRLIKINRGADTRLDTSSTSVSIGAPARITTSVGKEPSADLQPLDGR